MGSFTRRSLPSVDPMTCATRPASACRGVSARASQASSGSSCSAASARSSASSAVTRSWSVAWSASCSCSRASRCVQLVDAAARAGPAPCGRRAASAAGVALGPAPARRSAPPPACGRRGRPAAAAPRYSSTPPGRWPAGRRRAARRRVADPLEEVAVVRDDDQRARPGVEQVLERGRACRCRGRWSARRAAARWARR